MSLDSPDFEATTQGQMALRNFTQYKEETLNNDRLNTIRYLIPESSGYSNDILNRTIARQGAASQIAHEGEIGGQALGELENAYLRAQQPYQHRRGLLAGASAQEAQMKFEADQAKQAQLQQAIGGLSKNLGGVAGVAMQTQAANAAPASTAPGVGGNSPYGPYNTANGGYQFPREFTQGPTTYGY
ncbi:MAG TPA: hypothetical protein VFB26_00755 [Gaiellaceae bacterium]|nr:hypothetical protein [Gaiellaceae bacterium]